MIELLERSAEWVHADLMQQPVKEKQLKEPLVLVRRRQPDIAGPRNERLISLPGPAVISLFTGAGGMDVGMEQAGMCTVVQHEWSQAACETLICNRPTFFSHAALIQGDLRLTPTSMLLEEAGLRVGEAHIVAGGPPCQGFSTANTKACQGQYDLRNDLVFEYLRVVNEARPSFFMFENVPGFVTFNQHEYLKAFLQRAHECYYELVYGLLDAVEYGVPQYRCRFICMGTRRDLAECDGLMATLPKPETFHESDLTRIKLADTPLFPEEYHRLTHAPGIRYFPDRPLLIPPRPIAHTANDTAQRSTSFMDFYEKLERDEPDRIVRNPADDEGVA